MRVELLSLRQQLQYERRRRQRQREGSDDRGIRRQTQRERDQREDRCRDQHLREAEPEHRLAHRAQARRLQFQPDDEQQQHHAELGNVHDALGVLDDAQAPGSDGDACREVAEDGAETQSPEQRDRQHRGAEKDGDLSDEGHGRP